MSVIKQIDDAFDRKKFGDVTYNFTTVDRAMWGSVKHLVASLESQLASALAANQVMREALKGAKEFFDSDGDISCRSEMMIATAVRKALAIKPGDVTLVEVGKVKEVGGTLFASQYSPNNGVKVGDIVYTIKQKGKKDGN